MKKNLVILAMLVFSTTGVMAQDWPNLAKYQEENAQVLAQPNPGNRVVFMGNSITEGWKRVDPEFFEANKNYIDRGISGQTTPQMVLRFRQDVIDLKPAVVTILAGTNDIAGNTGPATLEQIFGNIQTMAQLAATYKIKVVLSSILPVFDYPWKPGLQPAAKIVKLNAMIKEFAAKNGFYYLDYHSLMKDDRDGLRAELGNDGVHPNKAGYAIMDKAVQEMLRKALSEKTKKH